MSTVVKMLEGDTEIPPPPFPFQHLVSGKPNLTASGSKEDSDGSEWLTESSKQPPSKSMNKTLEIEKSI
ncbi:hypothetical protein L6164_011653 [Bauhinia variegata]|uniref:Uncharacterized protein n=1 Tax=Bauhinia variegata TaxID=167791 RepID=A0ACB9P968_BAUVA|nr:hypothetical protein L6164_011653 [Bauhinia variegata]